ncbi:hypothetical protein ACJ72_07165 [Emergomyces africanus]|uniref:Uncharacterized protein n=1 Tax=Emergomyces africanus TaxID=1955775 RepID=A0A1B7NP01_9EURO|nr:hypothetical protein ACJ72_07165 [Emergomyces africanus]
MKEKWLMRIGPWGNNLTILTLFYLRIAFLAKNSQLHLLHNAAPSNNPAPDLASVLKTLSAYGPVALDRSTAPLNPPAESSNYSSHTRVTPVPRHATLEQNPGQVNQLANLPDSSTITTWPAALKYIMKTVAQNEDTQSKIRNLIRTQHDHEKQWWEGRQALVSKQAGREEKKKQLDEVLRSVGGVVANDSNGPNPQDDKIELDTYDKKVYKALTTMSKALDSELRRLGIPFFSIQHQLVDLSSDTASDSHSSGLLKSDDLTALQLRMLQFLEDLCKD